MRHEIDFTWLYLKMSMKGGNLQVDKAGTLPTASERGIAKYEVANMKLVNVGKLCTDS